MIIRCYCTKDNTIVNDYNYGYRSRSLNSNLGSTPYVSIYKELDTTSGSLYGDSYGRTLLYFDLGNYHKIMNYYNLNSSSISCSLFLKNIVHSDTVPTSYEIYCYPLSRSWDEGTGNDDIKFRDSGYSNWLSASSIVSWSQTGSDFITSSYALFNFDSGIEDLFGDITNIWNYWTTYGNNGAILKLSDVEENNDVDYFIKRFYSRHSSDKLFWPYIDVNVDDIRRDKRGSLNTGRSGSIYLYNIYDGQFEDLEIGSSSMLITLYDNTNQSSSSFSMSFTSSYIDIGTYASTIYVPNYSGTILYDVWSSGGIDYMTGSLNIIQQIPSQTYDPQKISVEITNLNRKYSSDEFARFNVFAKEFEWELNEFEAPHSLTPIKVFDDMFYQISTVPENEIIISASEYTKLSYDNQGMYFNFPISNLPAANFYEISFKIKRNKTYESYSDKFIFEIE